MCFFALQIISPEVHIFGFDGFKFLGKGGYIEIYMVSEIIHVNLDFSR